MTEEKEYPEEIYTEKMNVFGVWTCRMPDIADLEKAYDIGLAHGKEQAAQADQLAGFSNLTQAIQDGTRIDWERLNGRKAKCSHFVLGELTFRLDRNPNYAEDTHLGWIRDVSKIAPTWKTVMEDAWEDCGGWSLWIEGDIPVKPRTADELEPGTCFRARNEDRGVTAKYSRAQVIERAYDGKKVVLCYDATLRNVINIFSNPEEVEVIEVYGIGTLQAPKEEA